jgi:hypothetical protein
MMRGLVVLALLGLFCLTATLGCAPVPGGQAMSNITAQDGGSSPNTTLVSPQTTSAAE